MTFMQHSGKDVYPRIIPFVLFMFFVGIRDILHFLSARGIVQLDSTDFLLLYPIKIACVFVALIMYGPRYSEIRLRDVSRLSHTALSLSTGIIVFVLWVNMDWPFATFGSPQSYDPTVIGNDLTRKFIIISRVMGAVVVVPVMEEIFWRSFFLRYFISTDFTNVPLGYFTWGSFLSVTVLFGLEHNLFLAGIMAGAAYNVLFYYTRSVAQCILAHAVTNLALGVYVLNTGLWKFW